MDNALVVAVTEALAAGDVAALRFNFGGVGDSEGRFDQGRGEQCDVGAAEAALAARVAPGIPLAIVGYSFGAWVGAMAARGLARVARVVAIAPPLRFFDWTDAPAAALTVIAGDRDDFCPRDALERFASTSGAAVTILAGADHFFVGREREVAAAVVAALRSD
jgi:alpha/beta superfamily hydrolase